MLALRELSISSTADGDEHAVCLFGELDVASSDRVQREFKRVEASTARAIVVDLSGLTFIDSTGVRLLVDARSRVDADRLTLLRGRPAVQRVFELCGVDKLLAFAD